MKNTVILVGLIILIGVSTYFVLARKYSAPLQLTPPQRADPYQATLTGQFECLPHKKKSGPQTLECAFGLKTDSNEYYAVDFNLMSQPYPELNAGDRFSANGVITPIEYLSTNHWHKYNVTGVFSVTDSVIKL